MPPRKSKRNLPPRRGPGTTARRSVALTSPDSLPPENTTPTDTVNYENGNLVGESQQQREGKSFDYRHAGPEVEEVNLAYPGSVRPDISSYTNACVEQVGEPETDDSVETLVRSGLLRPEIDNQGRNGEMCIEADPLESDRAGSGSVRPEVHNYGGADGPEGNDSVLKGGNESLKEQGAACVGGSSGKRRVVKRVVRVVRKVVRKKVPKKDAKCDGLGNEEGDKIVSVTYLDERNDNLEMDTSVSESRDVEKGSTSVVAEEIEKEDLRNNVMEKVVDTEHSSVVSDVIESNNNELELGAKDEPSGLRKVRKLVEKRVPNKVAKGGKRVVDAMISDEKDENFEINKNVSESLTIVKENPSGVGSEETEKSKCSSDAGLMELKNEDSRNTVIKSMEIENYGSVVDSNAKGENNDELEVPIDVKPIESNRVEDQLGNRNKGTVHELPFSDKPVPMEDERSKDQLGTSAPPKIVPLEGEKSDGQLVKENAGSVGNNGMGLNGVKEPSEDDSNHGLVWSGEMEALERKKRRRKEVFVGGLDKDAKEEDVRKVFEEVGEIAELRLVMNSKTGKNKGFAFVRYTSPADAKTALTKYSKVEICGKECRVSPVEGNDTIFLGNINRNWKTEDVVKLLKESGIEKIDKVTVKANPKNVEQNRGFAFVEFETCKDAQSAFHKLQTKGAFGSYQKVKVAWAQPLIEPDEEEILKVKSVYAEYLPSSWDEEDVRDFFKRFGEIENVTLAKSLPSSRRKDFAFVNYTSREAALACVEAFSRQVIDNDGSKAKVKVSLAKPIPKGKQTKHLSDATTKELPKEKQKAAQSIRKPHDPVNNQNHAGSSYNGITVERRSSTNEELLQLLRQQAVSRQPQLGFSIGSSTVDRQFPSLGSKRSFSAMAGDSTFAESRGLAPLPVGRSYPVQRRSSMPSGVNMPSSSSYHHQGPSYASQAQSGDGNYPGQVQTRPQAFFYGNRGVHR